VVEAFDPRGDLVGSFTVTTDGSFGYMRVYGEDTSATPQIPGMRAGEAVTFKVNGYDATPSPSPITWQNNPNSVQISLAATSTVSPASLLSSISGQYDYVLGETGTFAPPPANQVFNNLNSMEVGKGYFLRMKQAANLVIKGSRVVVGTPMVLPQGWHWIGYLPTTTQNLPGSVDSITGHYDYLLGEDGTYAAPPAAPQFNTLSVMAPGKGYMVRMTGTGGTLVYVGP
jgi:hypothetical protein